DSMVTGVQTCALPISHSHTHTHTQTHTHTHTQGKEKMNPNPLPNYFFGEDYTAAVLVYNTFAFPSHDHTPCRAGRERGRQMLRRLWVWAVFISACVSEDNREPRE